jgi:hypothetical protein
MGLLQAAPSGGEKVWTDPEKALQEDPDFGVQGEYVNADAPGAIGVQVVALGGGRFDAYVLEGGLPGAGWEPAMKRTLISGAREENSVVLADAKNALRAAIEKGVLTLTQEDGTVKRLSRVDRHSPTLGAKPRDGAVVLFDGKSADQWTGGAMDQEFLKAGCTSKEKFGSYSLHLEFRVPYKPLDRGQGRGNSGVYHSGRWETQILDTFGLDVQDNHCGGIYSIAKPRLNMSLPPLSWQTYDVDFKAATFDDSGKRVAWPRITVRLNGVLVHEDLELAKDFTTAAPISTPLSDPTGPVNLQNHGNPVVYRNIWIVPGK